MNRSKIWKLDLRENHLLHTSAKMRACLKSRLLKSRPKEFLSSRGVKGCKCIHLSYRLRSKLGSKSWEQLGQRTQKLLNGSQAVGRGCFLARGGVLVPHGAWCWMWDMRALTDGAAAGRGGPFAHDTLTCSYVCAQTTCRTPLKSARSQRAWSICVGGTSGNGLIWKGVECCNFEYWGYWSYENVAFFFP